MNQKNVFFIFVYATSSQATWFLPLLNLASFHWLHLLYKRPVLAQSNYGSLSNTIFLGALSVLTEVWGSGGWPEKWLC